MNCNNFKEKIKVLLDIAKDNNILEEVFAGVEGNDRKKLQEILKTLKSQEQDEGQKTKINDWLAILAGSISGCKSNEKPLAPESSVPKTEKNIANSKSMEDTFKNENSTSEIENSDRHSQKDIAKATNKSIMIGSVCGVIAALAVGGGCFAAGVALPILALIGIAVAAFVLTGLVTGGIAYIALKPSDKLDASNTGKFEHAAQAI